MPGSGTRSVLKHEFSIVVLLEIKKNTYSYIYIRSNTVARGYWYFVYMKTGPDYIKHYHPFIYFSCWYKELGGFLKTEVHMIKKGYICEVWKSSYYYFDNLEIVHTNGSTVLLSVCVRHICFLYPTTVHVFLDTYTLILVPYLQFFFPFSFRHLFVCNSGAYRYCEYILTSMRTHKY